MLKYVKKICKIMVVCVVCFMTCFSDCDIVGADTIDNSNTDKCYKRNATVVQIKEYEAVGQDDIKYIYVVQVDGEPIRRMICSKENLRYEVGDMLECTIEIKTDNDENNYYSLSSYKKIDSCKQDYNLDIDHILNQKSSKILKNIIDMLVRISRSSKIDTI